MKRWTAAAFAVFFASGCAGTVEKHFKVFTEPADAEIRVLSGTELKEIKYRSPATIIAKAPTDPDLAKKAVLTVQRDSYKSFTMPLISIKDGQTLSIKLEKLVQVRYRLMIQLVKPEASDTLQFRDKTCAFSFAVADQVFQMQFENLSPFSAKILWDRTEYTDVYGRSHRLMHSRIRYPERNNPIPDQTVPSRATVQESVIPISSVVVSQKNKGYDLKPLFTLDSEAAAGLKGHVFNLFIPVEIDRQIVPYNFRFQITETIKESAGK